MPRLLAFALLVYGLSPSGLAHADNDAVQARAHMVQLQIVARGIRDPGVLRAMSKVPRHAFVPTAQRGRAYADRPLPIGHGQTISQPYIVALMTRLGRPHRGSKVLDVGTGSGYQAAVLAELADSVYGIEIICPLADSARSRLNQLGYENVTIRCGDGYEGWPEHAPFDLIILAAAPPEVPPALLAQLAPGGRLVLPVGKEQQQLVVYEKQRTGGLIKTEHEEVRFVPMTGKVQESTVSDPTKRDSPRAEK